MNKRFNVKLLLAVLICVLCVLYASSAFGAASKAVDGKHNGLVISTNWIADAVGQHILDQGGNAIDAAAAVGYALAVVHPTAGNLGGGGFAVIHLASGDNLVLDFREKAPAALHKWSYVNTDLDGSYNINANGDRVTTGGTPVSFDIADSDTYFARRYVLSGDVLGNASLNGPMGAGVPGTVMGLNEMLDKYGALSRAEVMEPAIDLAEEGFPLTGGTASGLNGQLRAQFRYYDGSKTYFSKARDGVANWEENDIFKQQELADTLKLIAASGDIAFYGDGTNAGIPKMIIDTLDRYPGENPGTESRMTLTDLANYNVVWRAPAEGTYRNYKVFSMSPPSSGGTHIVQILNTIESENIRTLGFNAKRTIWLMTEAMRYAYRDRSAYMGDPDQIVVPVDLLTSKDYAREIYNRIVAHGELKALSSDALPKDGAAWMHEGNETTHFSVVDSLGNAVAITYTINSGYGNKIAVEGAGFLMNNELDDFACVPEKPNSYGLIQGDANCVSPDKRPLSSMSPTIVLSSDNSVFLVTGSPGGSQIITTALHTVVNAIDHGMNISEVVSAPRFHMQWYPDTITYESNRPGFTGFTNDTISDLRAMGYSLSVTGSIGDVSAIMAGRDSTNSGIFLEGKNDPRTYYPPMRIPYAFGEAVTGLDDTRVSTVTVSPKNNIVLESGQSVALSATVAPWNSTNPLVIWSVNDPELATLTSTNSTTGAPVTVIANSSGKAGTVTVTVTADDGRVTDEVVVTIQPVEVTGITLENTSITLLSGASETLIAAIAPENATDKAITWTTSDNTVATVTSGTVTANTTKAGIATITATIGSFTASCTVTVNALIPPGGSVVTLPGGTTANLPGGTVTNPSGTIILPNSEGGKVTTPGGAEIDIPGGTEIGADGTIVLPSDKDGTLNLSGAQANLPGGSVIWPDGTIKLPNDKGSTLTGSDGVAVEFPGGSLLWPDGTLAVPPGKAISILTSDSLVAIEVSGNIMLEPDGTVTLLGNVAIETANGTMIEFTDGTIAEEMDATGAICLYISLEGNGGMVTYPDGKTNTISSGSVVKVNPDGSISIMGGRSGGGGGCNAGLAFITIMALACVMFLGRKGE